jgi:hypothetical protein
MVVLYPSLADSAFGGSIARGAITGTTKMIWEHRIVDIAPTAGGSILQLPDARSLGYDPRLTRAGFQFIVTNHGTQSTLIKDAGSTTLVTLAAGAAVKIWLTSKSTAAGTWIVRNYGSFARGSALGVTRVPFSLTIGITDASAYNLHDDLLGYYHWDGTSTVAVTLRIIIPRGSSTSSLPAIDTGVLPAGSTTVIIIGPSGVVAGMGGAGGRGGLAGISATGANGTAGGPAMRVWQDTTIANYGVIGGGGGGGGGGGAAAGPSSDGGGGGGGQGHGPSAGGAVGTLGASPGGSGTINVQGSGGASNGAGGRGGDGGAAGAAGTNGNNSTASGGTGGAAGPYMLRKTTATINWLVTGTRFGAEVTF